MPDILVSPLANRAKLKYSIWYWILRCLSDFCPKCILINVKCVVAWLSQGLCITWVDLYILPKFATVSTSTGLPFISVAWGGVEQWLDRNPKRNISSLLQIQKKTEKTAKKNYKIQKVQKKNCFWNTFVINHIWIYIVMFSMSLPFQQGVG